MSLLDQHLGILEQSAALLRHASRMRCDVERDVAQALAGSRESIARSRRLLDETKVQTWWPDGEDRGSAARAEFSRAAAVDLAGNRGVRPNLNTHEKIHRASTEVKRMSELSKPKRDSKSEATTQAARSIIEDEMAKRNAKTARLRAARLAHAPIPLLPKSQPKPKSQISR
ncbi:MULTISPECIES: hypothetical protein [unclassified Mesorhizobium]|uniref:hypothetical protein n=1 Tax=unclassified Mesorhizobium TaxID=325217 RepID=UPI000BB005AE|nr:MULTISPECIES: hypothetical protein [unclassified Mesorhizobium]TGT56824.1 hypothetical protein EN813_041110 [Mesorhizobium sp. M00.F.Ca.ET.170.01.1.1]AZO08592.1 hypothetical protein EJ074_05215 [Mesorhizobium sp. M3A.F.Ca.ET.080.04.2.1]PBB85470.1 hypothetical protein CK216_17595 [Mesorhizobium sp. WSM3876]RWB71709.1 MAG: hypothetical protein EOQ49_14425 [Mesorhizobium sp.]RWB85039.1 MAG: hypothetical protein EOQ52_22485 [Mesorhizobium sp.]